MKRAMAVLCLAGLLAAGCKSTGDPSPSESGSGSTAPMSTEPGQGVTADTLKVGVVYTDLAAIRDIVKIDHGDYLSAFQALADDINANGGINGRKLELVDGPINPVGTGSATTVCTKLTEDAKVFAAIGNLQADAAPCFVTDHDTALVGGQQTPPLVAAAKAPWFTYNADLEWSATQTVKGIGQSGGFKGKKVALVYIPVNEQLAKGAVSTELKAQGADVVSTAVMDAPPDDQAAANAQAVTIAQRFQADGADMVIAVGDAFQTFANNLRQTQYRPALVSTSSDVTEAYLVGADQAKYDVLGGMISGGPPSIKQAWKDPVLQQCVQKIKQRQPDRQISDPLTAGPDTPNTWVSVAVACQATSLFQAITQKAGATLNNDTFRQAGQTLGPFQVPGALGTSNYTKDSPAGQRPIFLARWNSSTNQLDYDSSPVS